MKIFRFMSEKEFEKYKNGEELINNTDHHEMGQKTNSVGFCFLNAKEFQPEYAAHFLSGIVGTGTILQKASGLENTICAVFETDGKNLKRTYGRYARPRSVKEIRAGVEAEAFFANEYCTTSYSKEKFKLLKYAKPIWFDWDYKHWDWKGKDE